MISGLTKHYVTSGMQKISSIYWFIIKIKQILESQDRKGHSYLAICIPKVTFSFPDTMYECAKN